MFRLLLLIALVPGCKATVGTNTLVEVPPDSRTRCEAYCRDLKLSLSSVVIMANEVGCVCSVASVTADASDAGSAMAAGVLAKKAKERRAQDEQQRGAEQH
jgi:hypothetical protein